MLRDIPEWNAGLSTGANGPIPHIVVDQFGYRPEAQKVAVIRDPNVGFDNVARFSPGTRYAVVDTATKAIVKEGAPTPWKNGAIDPYSGDRAWWFDFSDVVQPGSYFILDLERRVRSPDFRIASDVYKSVLQAAVRTFYFQRAGFEKVQALAGPWADRASHLGRGQDTEARPWPGTMGSATDENSAVRDLRGGWYDAGDFNKYTNWTARVVILLLRAYSEHPQAFDDATRIPESGNGVPDILDELKWGLEWLMRMQNSDGSLLCVQGLASGSPPSSARGPSSYGPPTTSATLSGAAAFAFAAAVYQSRPEEDLKRFAADLAKRSEAAWAWASRHPDVRYFNNDNGKQPGSAGLAAGQQEMAEDARKAIQFEAALNLYKLTNAQPYRAYIDAHASDVDDPHGPSQWSVYRSEALFAYLALEHVPANVRLRAQQILLSKMESAQFQVEALRRGADPYLSPIKDYTWGSNQSKMFQARMYQLYVKHVPRPQAAYNVERDIGGFLHYIHGVNPLGLVYLSNMKAAGASHSVKTMFHAWFAAGTKWSEAEGPAPGPAPGYLVGGPNPGFAVAQCCSGPPGRFGFRCDSLSNQSMCVRDLAPPLEQPPTKAYLQFNTDWPMHSWEVTEPSTGYQANYILVLAAFVP